MATARRWSGLDIPGLFKEFLARLVVFKTMIAAGRVDWAALGHSAPADDDPAAEARRISADLRKLLQDQIDFVSRNATESELDAFKQGVYVMTALADEVFLIQLNWPGRRHWPPQLLEGALFGTSSAGDEFFHRLARLLRKEVLTAVEKQLAQVYLMALRLGFCGRYRGHDEQLMNARQHLFKKIGAVADEHAALFPQAYDSVINPVVAQRLSPIARWHRITLGALLGFLLVSSMVWIWITRSLLAELP